MDDLTLVGVHDDGEHLVLKSAGGHTFRLRLDDALRAAVRRDRSRLGQIQLESDSGLRPREIQARIRSGQTAEQISESAGVPIEYVRRYEGPVLAEREFIATQARGVRLRRSGPGGTTTLTLGDLVTRRLSQLDHEDHHLSWDAWRDEDGNWVIGLAFGEGDARRRAHWTYQPQARHVQSLDEEAHRLSDDVPLETGPLDRHRPERLRRTADQRVYDIDADGGASTFPSAADSPSGQVTSATADLLDTLRERRGRRQRLAAEQEETPDAPPDEVDSAVESLRSRAEALGNPPSAHPPRSRPEQAVDAEVLQLPEDEEYTVRRTSTRSPQRTRTRQADRPARLNDGDRSSSGDDARAAPSKTAARGSRSRGASATGGRATDARPASPAASKASPPRATKASPPRATKDSPPGDTEAESTETGTERKPRPASSRRSARRASVPSWDDILFGSRRE
jgi:hypothetical protein